MKCFVNYEVFFEARGGSTLESHPTNDFHHNRRRLCAGLVGAPPFVVGCLRMESPYSKAVEKADVMLADGRISKDEFAKIVRSDAQFQIEEARSERDEALLRLEEVSLRPVRVPSSEEPRVIDFEAEVNCEREINFDIVGDRLNTIKENPTAAVVTSSDVSGDTPLRDRLVLDANMPVAKRIGGDAADVQKKSKGGLASRGVEDLFLQRVVFRDHVCRAPPAPYETVEEREMISPPGGVGPPG